MKKIFLCAFVMMLSIGLFGSYFLNPYEGEIIDSKGEALGRTSILSSSGANNLFNNPALLAHLTKKNISISTKSKVGATQVKRKIDEASENIKYKYRLHNQLNGISYGMPFNFKKLNNYSFGFGIGHRMYFDHAYNEEYTSSEIDYEYPVETRSHGGYSNFLVLGASVSYKKQFSFGFSLSLSTFLSPSVEYKYIDNYGNVYKNDTGAATYRGNFLTFSSIYVINKDLTIGVRWRNKFSFENEHDNQIYSGYGEDSIYEVEITDIPSEIGFAASIGYIKNLRFYVELITRNFSDYKLSTRYYSPDNSDIDYTGDSYSLTSYDGFSFRFGTEIDTGHFFYTNKYINDHCFRFGGFVQSVPIFKDNGNDIELQENIFEGKPQNEIGFSLGSNIILFKRFSFSSHLVSSFVNYEENFIDSETNVSISNDYSHFRLFSGMSIGYEF